MYKSREQKKYLWGLCIRKSQNQESRTTNFPEQTPTTAKEIRTMRERELREFQQILKYFPLVGVPIVELANITGIGYTTLYHYRNGLKPKEEKYRYIMAQIKKHFPKELKKVGLYIQIDRELAKGGNE